MSFWEIEYCESEFRNHGNDHMIRQKKDKGQFYQMLSLDLENGLHSSSERSWQKGQSLFFIHFQHLTLK